jgi:hypothetical protein
MDFGARLLGFKSHLHSLSKLLNLHLFVCKVDILLVPS